MVSCKITEICQILAPLDPKAFPMAVFWGLGFYMTMNNELVKCSVKKLHTAPLTYNSGTVDSSSHSLSRITF